MAELSMFLSWKMPRSMVFQISQKQGRVLSIFAQDILFEVVEEIENC